MRFINEYDQEDHVFYVREYLNKSKGSIASILAEVKGSIGRYSSVKDKMINKGLINYVSTTLIISDCNRNINLEFEVDESDESYKNDMDKLDLIIETLMDFKDACEIARKKYLEDKLEIKRIERESKE